MKYDIGYHDILGRNIWWFTIGRRHHQRAKPGHSRLLLSHHTQTIKGKRGNQWIWEKAKYKHGGTFSSSRI